jgi:mannose-6-phosphate isomerase-like protein (cupin superfamily)
MKLSVMKLMLAVAALCAGAFVMTGAGGSAPVTYIGHDKVAAALAKGTVLVTQPDLKVEGAHRNGPGQVEVHAKETDVIYITDGTATFVTGGTVVGGKTTAPGQIRGTSIQGGETHHLSKGDVVVVPNNTPHWFKEVPGQVSYYVVKVIKP